MIDKIQILDNNIIELAKTFHTEQNTKIAKFLTEYNLAFLTEIIFPFCERFLVKCKVAFLC